MSENDNAACEQVHNPWHYFKKSEDSATAECKTCKKVIKTKSGNTSGLHYHLKSHNIEAKKIKRSCKESKVEAKQSTSQPSEKRVKLGDKLASEETLPAMLARMTARGGLTFKVFQTDPDLRLCVQARLDQLGNEEELPKSDKSIKNLVMKYGEKVKAAVTESFKTMRSKGIKFSLSFDEWTNMACKRYINVIVFGPANMLWSLGLIKITGRATAYHLMELILERLHLFEIDFNDDIVSITTDGASTMTKLGREDSLAQHHLCLIHGVHLAVLDVLYVKNESSEQNIVAFADVDADNQISDVDTNDQGPDVDTNDQIADEEMDVIENEEGFRVVELETTGIFHDQSIKHTIAKIREIGSFFKKSAISNEILQSYVQAQYKNPKLEMRLKVDTKTRWNSLYDMLDRYWRIKDCLDKTLIDIKYKVSITQKHKYIISCILTTLRPVMHVVKNLSRRDSSLVKARISFIMLFKQLMRKSNPLTNAFIRRLHSRMSQRWTINYGVLSYLHYGSLSNDILTNNFGVNVADESIYDFPCEDEEGLRFSYDTVDADVSSNDNYVLDMFKIPNRNIIKSHMMELIKRLYPPNEDDDPTSNLTPVEGQGTKSFEQMLNDAMKEVDSNNLSTDLSDLSKISKRLTAELNHFDKTKIRIGNVLKIYEALLTTKPSSVESERAFSLASYLCSKLRSRLNDSTLDTLSFLRSFFKEPHIYEINSEDF